MKGYAGAKKPLPPENKPFSPGTAAFALGLMRTDYARLAAVRLTARTAAARAMNGFPWRVPATLR